jgi:hypothetical protein
VGQIVEASNEIRIELGDEVLIQVFPDFLAPSNRARLVPLALAYGSTGVSFPVRAATALPSERDGWITVVRDGADVADAPGTPARVRWGRSVSRAADEGALGADGPIAFASDGYQLTIRWSGCDGPDSACTSVLGGLTAEPRP